jgi:dienelactone hydrolase
MSTTRFVGALLAFVPLTARAADAPLAAYFRAETAKLAARPLQGIDSAEAWKARRPELQRQLREMLGLDPLPERTDLKVKVTGIVERTDFVIEKILYQSRPGLYVTANLYRPKEVKAPLPAILYVCGHSKVEKDGIIYGCKAHYQHHPAWYAANGYVCLIVDTLQLGELPGLHHGTYYEGMYWWWSRGYTPAGVEAWNGIRGIDYLCSRPEVDKTRIGVTGRSGGGATSWWIGALDDRVSAVVPVAGITDLTNHVVDGVVEGHCDCMYFINTYRWDFPTVAALVAPKALFVENTDHDDIFPEDGVRRVYAQLEKVYGWYGASDRLGLLIGKGAHVDSPELRHASFAFFNKWLKGKEGPIEEPDRKVPIEELKVLKVGEVPEGNRNGTVQEWFVPKAKEPEVPKSREELERLQKAWLDELRVKTFGGWPKESDAVPLDAKVMFDETRKGIRLRRVEYTSQDGVRLSCWVLRHTRSEVPTFLSIAIVDDLTWTKYWSHLADPIRAESFGPPDSDDLLPDLPSTLFRRGFHDFVLIAPRGAGPCAWDAKVDTHIRRRFMLLGQTLETMQIWDIRRGLAALESLRIPSLTKGSDGNLYGNRQSAGLALWVAVFEPQLGHVVLWEPPVTLRHEPIFLNAARILDIPQAIALVHPRSVIVGTFGAGDWLWDVQLSERVKTDPIWFKSYTGKKP